MSEPINTDAQSSHLKAAQAYAKSFEGEMRLTKHINKFSQRADIIRDKIELEIIARYAYGDLFDCSIGFGRFVGRLPNLTSYSGMDISASNVNYVKERYPEVKVSLGNLLDGIKQPDNQFDVVLCIRTLPVLPNVDQIMKDMARITKPGGLIIITYGMKSVNATINGYTYKSCNYDIKEICQRIKLDEVAKIEKDALLVRVKKYGFIKKLFQSRWNILPDAVLAKADTALSRLNLGLDYILILRKV